MSFDGWLDARDGETLAREWESLGATRTELGVHPRFVLGIRPEGGSLLAAAWLGCSPDRFSWFATEEGKPPPNRPAPIFTVGREVSRCFIDGILLSSEAALAERWTIHEVTEGARGIQFITIEYFYGAETRDGSGGGGGSATVLRLFDRSAARGVSVRLCGREVFTIGEPVELSPLDLFAQRVDYKLPWRALELSAVRGFVAQLTSDLDAHFDTSAEWEGGVTRDEVLESKQYNFRTRRREFRFQAGPYAIELGENLDPDIVDDETGMFAIHVRGLPWGHGVFIRIALDAALPAVEGWIDFMLPMAQLEAAVTRASKIPGIRI